MDMRQLHYFREIVRQGNISKAAEVLHMAQPPLSQILKKLETELGTILIHRYRKKWELTETGKLLYQYAEEMSTQTQNVKQRIQEIEQGIAGTVRIGVSSSCSNIILDYISIFRAQFPNIKMIIITGNSEELLKRLEQKEIDIALLLRLADSQKYEMKIFKKQPAVVIIPTNWATPFTTRHVTLEQIAHFPFIMLGAMEGHSFYDDLLQAFSEQQLKPNIIIECKDITMVAALVSKGIGISIIPRMNYSSFSIEQVRLFELKKFDFRVEPIFLRLRDEPLSKAVTQFWESIED
jgi:DNA-binding transcriptional LysR family regulator